MQSSTVLPVQDVSADTSEPRARQACGTVSSRSTGGASVRTGTELCCAGRRPRVLVFTTVFPNSAQALHGLFVAERVRHTANLAEVHVVAPVPWYPWIRRRVARQEQCGGVAVEHPTFFYIPRMLKALDGVCLFFATVTAIYRLRRRFDFDLIDAHFAYPDGFAAVLLGRLFRKPVSVTLRGTIIPLSAYPIRRMLCDWTIRRADRVIAVSENLADRARQGGVSEERLAVIENGVDVERFRPQPRDAARQALGLARDGRLIVSVGHLSARKGFHRLIQALPSVLRQCPDLCLAIVGGPGAEADNGPVLRQLAAELSVTRHVIFAGPEPPDRVAIWLNAADALVFASQFEGCPNVVLEALACARPVVATKVGHVERLVPPFAGILVDVDDDAGLVGATVDVLRRTWDPQRIRAYMAPQTWDAVAGRVVSQWAVALGSGRSVEGPTAAAVRVPPEPQS